jgi:hypothetical protein
LKTYRPKAGKSGGWKTGRAINQRVKSAVGTDQKIEPDSRAIEREKELRPSGRPLGRIALYLLFATKVP